MGEKHKKRKLMLIRISVACIKEILIRRPEHLDLLRRGSKKNLKPFFIDLAHRTQWIKYYLVFYPILTQQ